MPTTVRVRQRIDDGIDRWLQPFLADTHHETPVVVRRGTNPQQVIVELSFRSPADAEAFLSGEALARAADKAELDIEIITADAPPPAEAAAQGSRGGAPESRSD